ncbi:MAG: restriction endonuclease subunit S [Pseudomonadota bacterium]
MTDHYLPEGWVSDILGNLVNISIGKTPKRSDSRYWNGKYKWASISDMKFGQELFETKERITDIALQETKPRLAKKGSLLFSFKLTIGKMAFAGCDLYTNEAIAALVPKNDSIDSKFLFYALQVANLTVNAGDAAKGATLNTKTMPLIEVSFPSDPDEQRRIVARIEGLTRRAEEARRLRQEAIAKTSKQFFHVRRKIFESLMADCPTKPLGKCGKVIGGGTPSKNRTDYWNGNIPWISAKEMKSFELIDSELKITDKGLSESSAKLIPENSVLFVVRGSILYRYVPVALNKISCTINQDLKAIVPHDNINAVFLAHMLWGTNDLLQGMVETAGNTAGKLPTPSWSAFEIPIPDMKTQNSIVQGLREYQDKLDELESLQSEAAKEMEQFQPALLTKAFRGEL